MTNLSNRRRFFESFDHRLETLEGRSLMSAAAAPESAPAATPPAPVIADEAFLSAGSDHTANPADDSQMYDFGNTWGSHAAASATQTADHHVDLDDGAVDQMGGQPPTTITPPDLIAVAPPQWHAPADYTPIPTPIADSPATPSATVETPAPIANSPATPIPASVPADQTPVILAPEGASAANTTFVWLKSSESWLLTTKAKAAEQIVIASTFVQH